MHSGRGKGFGLVLVMLLLAALVVVFLTLKQMTSLGFGGGAGESPWNDPVEQAQEAVDAVNERMGRSGSMDAP